MTEHIEMTHAELIRTLRHLGSYYKLEKIHSPAWVTDVAWWLAKLATAHIENPISKKA